MDDHRLNPYQPASSRSTSNDGLMNLATVAGQHQLGVRHSQSPALSNPQLNTNRQFDYNSHKRNSPYDSHATPLGTTVSSPGNGLLLPPPVPQAQSPLPPTPSSTTYSPPSGPPTTSNPNSPVAADTTSPATVAGLTKTDKGLFQCGYCKKTYNRADHLIRHVRSHTREKPYVCEVCHKGFSRPDLVKRHAAGHGVEANGKRRRMVISSSAGRVTQACKSCAAAKLKCAEEKPCRRCKSKGLTCEYSTYEGGGGGEEDGAETPNAVDSGDEGEEELVRKTPGPDTKVRPSPYMMMETDNIPPIQPRQLAGPGQSIPDSARYAQPDMSRHILNIPMPNTTVAQSGVTTSASVGPQMATSDAMIGNQTVSSFMDDGTGVVELDGTFFPNFSLDFSAPTFLDALSAFDPWVYHNYDYTPQAFVGPIGSQLQGDRNNTGYGQSGQYNQGPTLNTQQTKLEPTIPAGLDKRANVAIGSDAFKRSALLMDWIPELQVAETRLADEADFTVPRDIASLGLRFSPEREVVGEHLTDGTRDSIMCTVVDMYRRFDMPRMLSSFPSTEVLDFLIQTYFIDQVSRVDACIHVPTFQLNDARIELLCTLAATGAMRTPVPLIRKLGYALVEVVKLAIPARIEESKDRNSDLEILQTIQLCLPISLWSGSSRKCELAESLQGPPVTLLRRSRKFRRSGYVTIYVGRQDEGEELEQKWKQWVKYESFKRLVYRAWFHDGQSSIFLNNKRLMSYAEMNLPLPEARELWDAKTASQWKELYLAKRGTNPERIPSLTECLQDMSLLSIYASRLDTQMTSMIVLHGLSALVWEHHRMKSMSNNGQSRHWNALVLSSRHQELASAIQHFRMVTADWGYSPEVQLMQELLSMHLYMSLEELQIFAGKEDKEEARRVYHSARQWFDSPSSRHAVWHAGQVIRAAKFMPMASLTDFYAIVIYHASICFWSYAIVSRSTDAESGSASRPVNNVNPIGNEQPIIWLDESETTDHACFIALKKGNPGLRGVDGVHVFLDDPQAVMKCTRELMKQNHRGGALPPLVELLCQLMRDLGNAAKTDGEMTG